jgi:hypothetical protein
VDSFWDLENTKHQTLNTKHRTVLSIFGKLAYPDFDLISLIGSAKMRESPMYQQIRDEGRVEAKRESILAVLEERFGPMAAAQVSTKVNKVEDLKKLDQINRWAVRCADPEEFKTALEGEKTIPRRRGRSPRQR